MKKKKIDSKGKTDEPTINKEEGLADVVACNSSICFIDGEGGA